MASISMRGKNTYLIRVSDGYDSDGKKISHSKTVKLTPCMTTKQQEKEIAIIATKFEEQVKSRKYVD